MRPAWRGTHVLRCVWCPGIGPMLWPAASGGAPSLEAARAPHGSRRHAPTAWPHRAPIRTRSPPAAARAADSGALLQQLHAAGGLWSEFIPDDGWLVLAAPGFERGPAAAAARSVVRTRGHGGQGAGGARAGTGGGAPRRGGWRAASTRPGRLHA